MKKYCFFILLLFTCLSRAHESRLKVGVKRLLANNLQVIDQDERSGFAIYRIGLPGKHDMIEMCNHGIEEIYVLSGNAIDAEFKYQRKCPSLKVVYNEKQDVHIPLDSKFLSKFDEWINNAKIHGKKIAFRCDCGCHRTGRLAAYYQMKFMNFQPNLAIRYMHEIGKFMYLYPFLNDQIFGLFDYINNRMCSLDAQFCVKE